MNPRVSKGGVRLLSWLSNILLKPSDPESKLMSESNSFGGVAVLAVLAVMALSRVTVFMVGDSSCPVPGREEPIGDDLGLFVPKENVRPAFARRDATGRDSGIGGTGISWSALFNEKELSPCVGMSVEEGSVDEELKRAEDAELSYRPPVEAELSVPPLPLDRVNTRST
jgi:hypothetical protein